MHDVSYVIIGDKVVGFEILPVIRDDRTLVPMRFLFEQIGVDVEWNQETQTAIATMNNTAVAFSINTQKQKQTVQLQQWMYLQG